MEPASCLAASVAAWILVAASTQFVSGANKNFLFRNIGRTPLIHGSRRALIVKKLHESRP